MPLLYNPQVTPWIIGNEPSIMASVATTTLAANVVYLYAFEVNSSLSISAVRYRLGAAATGTLDVGIYDVNGTLLRHSGAIANAANTTMTTNLLSVLPLSQGKYFLAGCPSNSTDTYVSFSAAANHAVLTRARTGTNPGVAGVLPASAGGHAVAIVSIGMAAIIVGGLS